MANKKTSKYFYKKIIKKFTITKFFFENYKLKHISVNRFFFRFFGFSNPFFKIGHKKNVQNGKMDRRIEKCL
jgi:hypothetical protein|tara:strand:- start:27 stop:242 length:216 start_codon:yes stop_codon:yes gene_type:complete